MVRCASPVILFRRTAAADTRLGGVDIAEGDSVVMFYESANRDESAFRDPERFDITRSPNPHVGFGGGGVHFCLGANLARVELRALFTRLAARAASIEAGEPSYLVSNAFNGIKRMPVRAVERWALMPWQEDPGERSPGRGSSVRPERSPWAEGWGCPRR